jgi:hypothetical protein
MSLTFAQLRAMTLYEFRMHWRRKGMVAVTAVIIFSAIAGVLSGNFNSSQVIDAQARLAAQGLSSATLMTSLTSIVLMITWISMIPSLFFILPMVSCDAAALDQQYGVSDLLDGLPLPSSVYLIGKLFGVWAAGLGSRSGQRPDFDACRYRHLAVCRWHF